MKILNFGSMNIDLVYEVEHFVRAGETLSSYQMKKYCGGKGLNQSVALARAGAEVYHAGCVGADGKELLQYLEKSNVNVTHIREVDEVSGHAIIQVDNNGENCILLYGGANYQVTPEQINHVLSCFDKGDFLLIQNEINLLEDIIENAYERGMIIAFNPSPISEAMMKLPLDKITYFIMNEIEGRQLTGENKEEVMLQSLRKSYPHSKIVLTLGSSGSIYEDQSIHCRQGIYQVNAVDTTAAGDTFTGYFLNEISRGEAPAQALRMAAKASALAVSKMGAAPSIPLASEVSTAELMLK